MRATMSSKSLLFVDAERGVNWQTAQTEHYAKQEGFSLFKCLVGHTMDAGKGLLCPAVIMEWGTGRPIALCRYPQTSWEAVR